MLCKETTQVGENTAMGHSHSLLLRPKAAQSAVLGEQWEARQEG